MKTMNNGTTAAKVNNSNESKNRVNNVAMPAGEYGDLCYDYFGKSSVIVFGNTNDHAAQLEAIGGKYGDRLRYSALQNGRKWTEKQGRTRGYYFTTEEGKREAVQYVQRVNHAIFDKYEQSTKGGEHLKQKPADFKAGDRVRTIHGLGTVTDHTPKYNAAQSVCVKLDKSTYNYGWKGMPQTFIECRCDEITRYSPSAKSKESREFTNPDDDRQVLATMEAGRVKFYADWLPLFDILENLGGMPEGDRKQFRCHMSDLYDVVENIGVHINCPHVYLPEDHNALMDMISEAGTDLQHLRAMISVYKAMAKKQDGYVWFEAA